jgi:hypothetical protein
MHLNSGLDRLNVTDRQSFVCIIFIFRWGVEARKTIRLKG